MDGIWAAPRALGAPRRRPDPRCPDEENIVLQQFVRSGNRLLYWVIVIQVGAIAATVNLQVFNRYVLNYVLGWEEEVARYLMVWSSFLAAAYALWQGEQLGMEFVVKLLPERGRRVVRILANLLCIAFLAVIAYQGFVWMMPQQLNQVSTSLRITMAIPYAAIPVSAVMMIWVEVLFIWRELQGKETAQEPTTAPLPL
jgi:TRAP-type C4-dicarboxylate transport system permease small subunit